MNCDDARKEFLIALGKVADFAKIREANHEFETLEVELNYAESKGTIEPIALAIGKAQIARAGLELQQRIIPALAQLSGRLLQFAGRSAVQQVCAPIRREGTGHDGQPLPPLLSGFNVPPEYESVDRKIVGAVEGAAASVAAAVVGLLTLRGH